MEDLRVIRVPLVFVGLAAVLTAMHPGRGWVYLAIMVGLTLTRWAEWRYWPHLRFRVRRWWR